MSNIVELITPLAAPLAASLGLELVDVEYIKEGSQMILRVFIDKEGGISLDDCEAYSSVLSDELDRTDPIEQNYLLEVSSPGAERPLKKPADFDRFAGRQVNIKLFSPLEGQKNYRGILLGKEQDIILLEVKGGRTLRIPLPLVAKANLTFV